ncbi:MAG TPA: hypothetical protein VHY83_05480 [Solirubrobacteraceae bacterium]|jgi:hypothetical protein|nr:hypothetical protein [Solirubrobacteraceae bacterium]
MSGHAPGPAWQQTEPVHTFLSVRRQLLPLLVFGGTVPADQPEGTPWNP